MNVMDKFKKFLDKKKVNANFKKAGEGHSLTAQPQPSSPKKLFAPSPKQKAPSPDAEAAKRAAANAALKRSAGPSGNKSGGAALTTSQKAIREQARRELEKDAQASASAKGGAEARAAETEYLSHSATVDEAVGGIYFTCDLLSDEVVLPRHEMQEKVMDILLQLSAEEPLQSSAAMIHTFGRDKKQTCIDTLTKYMDNIIGNPSEEKFRKIRLGNKAFQERVGSVAGGKQFLISAGFQEKMLPSAPGTVAEEHLFMEEDAVNIETLETHKACLAVAEPVPIKIFRNPSVLVPNSRPLESVVLPDAFFIRSSSELKEEQQRMSNEVDRMLSLRTREMRERDERVGSRRYRYTLLRIRFPPWEGDKSDLTLQIMFSASENLSDVKTYVQGFLDADWAPFELATPVDGVLTDYESSLETLGLVPAALLTFQWDPDVQQQWRQTGQSQSFLRADWKAEAKQV